ncbi:DNA translocase FtsK [Acinetobacter sp. UBA2581]|uniref:DNA translocase FtsK n=1 Tax=Acinetobacter sp. UBA2581 TaxID=1945932 RepID=UPI00257E871F|nr:DNA translocase FtsK [Acinetobacter sp. UBA2581]
MPCLFPCSVSKIKTGGVMDISEEDYQKAVAVVRKCLSGSVSNLQRKLYWGYGRAASAIDRMQDEFIVSPMSASGRRDVYPEETHELWKELQAAKAVPEKTVKLHLVWNENKDECVGFLDSKDARYTATGDYRGMFGVTALGDYFRDLNDERNEFETQIVMIEAQEPAND